MENKTYDIVDYKGNVWASDIQTLEAAKRKLADIVAAIGEVSAMEIELEILGD